jgi:soluble lytic murein transglycosylase
MRDADDGCTNAADRLLGEKKLTPLDAWRKARLAVEANRPQGGACRGRARRARCRRAGARA